MFYRTNIQNVTQTISKIVLYIGFDKISISLVIFFFFQVILALIYL